MIYAAWSSNSDKKGIYMFSYHVVVLNGCKCNPHPEPSGIFILKTVYCLIR
jgi:hypothetical protein